MEDYRVYRMNRREKTVFYTAGYICMFFLSYLFYKSFFLSAAAGFSICFFRRYACGFLNDRRRHKLLLQFRDLLFSLGSSVATGRYMTEALLEGEKAMKMVTGEESMMVKELVYINRQIQENHYSEEEMLMDFAGRSGMEDIRNFVETYSICKMTGGDMQSVISSTSSMIAEKIKLQQELRNMMLEKQFEGRIVGAVPVLVIIFLNTASPEYLAPLYCTFTGRIVMTLSLAGFAAALVWMRKLTEEHEI